MRRSSRPGRAARAAAAAALVLALVAALAGCSAGGDASASFSPLPVVPAPSGLEKLSATDSTKDQVVAALTAAGVADPTRWATEVVEYRPYDPGDPALTELQRQLAKYHPDDATLRGILAALKP